MELVKLKGVTKDYIWGGKKLFSFNKSSCQEIIAESWELSFYPGSESIIDSGENKGRLLSEVVNKNDLGKNVLKYQFFPVLIKLIDANKDLSIQVHPSDDYALKYENSYGKTEMWYIIDADEGAMIHLGFNKDISKEEVEERIKNNTITDVMNHVMVHKGDCYLIPSGTVHAIGKGCLIIEIQENSNLTYRVYDYGRLGQDGKPRELHIEKALKVMDLNKYKPVNNRVNPLVNTIYFQVNKLENPKVIEADKNSFVCFTILEGEGEIDNIPFAKGDTFFLPSKQRAVIKGNSLIVETRIN